MYGIFNVLHHCVTDRADGVSPSLLSLSLLLDFLREHTSIVSSFEILHSSTLFRSPCVAANFSLSSSFCHQHSLFHSLTLPLPFMTSRANFLLFGVCVCVFAVVTAIMISDFLVGFFIRNLVYGYILYPGLGQSPESQTQRIRSFTTLTYFVINTCFAYMKNEIQTHTHTHPVFHVDKC